MARTVFSVILIMLAAISVANASEPTAQQLASYHEIEQKMARMEQAISAVQDTHCSSLVGWKRLDCEAAFKELSKLQKTTHAAQLAYKKAMIYGEPTADKKSTMESAERAFNKKMDEIEHDFPDPKKTAQK